MDDVRALGELAVSCLQLSAIAAVETEGIQGIQAQVLYERGNINHQQEEEK